MAHRPPGHPACPACPAARPPGCPAAVRRVAADDPKRRPEARRASRIRWQRGGMRIKRTRKLQNKACRDQDAWLVMIGNRSLRVASMAYTECTGVSSPGPFGSSADAHAG